MKYIKTVTGKHADQCAVIFTKFREGGAYEAVLYKSGTPLSNQIITGGTLEAVEKEVAEWMDDEWTLPENSTTSFEVKLTVDNTFAADVLVTATEGGISYWARTKTLQSVEEGRVGVDTVVLVEDCTGEDAGVDLPKLLDLEVIRKGIKQAITDKDALRQDIAEEILKAVAFDDVGLIDAEAADCIVQLGLFGEIVFG